MWPRCSARSPWFKFNKVIITIPTVFLYFPTVCVPYRNEIPLSEFIFFIPSAFHKFPFPTTTTQHLVKDAVIELLAFNEINYNYNLFLKIWQFFSLFRTTSSKIQLADMAECSMKSDVDFPVDGWNGKCWLIERILIKF